MREEPRTASHSTATALTLLTGLQLPEDQAGMVVLSVRGEPLLHSGRVAASCAPGKSRGTLGEKFAVRHRSAALIAIFTQSVCVCVCV